MMPDDAASRRHDRALGHQLADAIGTRGAKRGTDRELMTPGHRLRDDDARDVRAGNDDDEQPDQRQDRQEDSNVEP